MLILILANILLIMLSNLSLSQSISIEDNAFDHLKEYNDMGKFCLNNL